MRDCWRCFYFQNSGLFRSLCFFCSLILFSYVINSKYVTINVILSDSWSQHPIIFSIIKIIYFISLNSPLWTHWFHRRFSHFLQYFIFSRPRKFLLIWLFHYFFKISFLLALCSFSRPWLVLFDLYFVGAWTRNMLFNCILILEITPSFQKFFLRLIDTWKKLFCSDSFCRIFIFFYYLILQTASRVVSMNFSFLMQNVVYLFDLHPLKVTSLIIINK